MEKAAMEENVNNISSGDSSGGHKVNKRKLLQTEKSTKKPKFIWTRDLHNRFLAAINTIGLDRVVPKRILEEMSDVPGLNRVNIASHLQKYRMLLRRVSDENHKLQKNLRLETLAMMSQYNHSYSFPNFGQSQLLSSRGCLSLPNPGLGNGRLDNHAHNYRNEYHSRPPVATTTYDHFPQAQMNEQTVRPSNYVGYSISDIQNVIKSQGLSSSNSGQMNGVSSGVGIASSSSSNAPQQQLEDEFFAGFSPSDGDDQLHFGSYCDEPNFDLSEFDIMLKQLEEESCGAMLGNGGDDMQLPCVDDPIFDISELDTIMCTQFEEELGAGILPEHNQLNIQNDPQVQPMAPRQLPNPNFETPVQNIGSGSWTNLEFNGEMSEFWDNIPSLDQPLNQLQSSPQGFGMSAPLNEFVGFGMSAQDTQIMDLPINELQNTSNFGISSHFDETLINEPQIYGEHISTSSLINSPQLNNTVFPYAKLNDYNL